MSRLLGLPVAFVLVVAACGGRAPAGQTTPPVSAAAVQATDRPIAPSSAVPSASAASADIAVVRVRGTDGSAYEELAIDARTNAVLTRLPDGPLSPDHRTLFATRQAAGDTQVQALDAATGAAATYRTIPGAWTLPTIGSDRTPIGLSSDGSALVLEAPDATSGRSRFAVLAADLASDPTVIDLAGDFDVDGVSPGGTTLYLVERRDGRDYAIRSLDVATGGLDPDPVVDKREGGEAMVGSAIGRVVSTSWLHTLYLADEPFLHSLDASNRFTFCIELSPSVTTAGELALAMAPDGSHGWIVDVSAGRLIAVDVDAGTATAPRSVRGLSAASAATDASTARAIAFDPAVVDGNRIVIASSAGIVALDASTRSAFRLSSEHVAGIGESAHGAVVAVTDAGVPISVER